MIFNTNFIVFSLIPEIYDVKILKDRPILQYSKAVQSRLLYMLYVVLIVCVYTIRLYCG